jgi:hypothetical protein
MSTRTVQNELDKNFSIAIRHLSSGDIVSFSAFTTQFKDSYKQTWTPEPVYGRMDPIYFYQNTTRNIQMSFDVPSESLTDAQANFKKLSKLINFGYPTYEKSKEVSQSTSTQAPATSTTEQASKDAQKQISSEKISFTGNALLISSPPLISISFANFVSSPFNNSSLIGKIDGVSFETNDKTTYHSIGKNLYPTVYSVTLNFDVIHSVPLGWERSGDRTVRRDNKRFPYGV